jgi:hypothetical protein
MTKRKVCVNCYRPSRPKMVLNPPIPGCDNHLQTDGFDYLCPQCGGYGTVLEGKMTCPCCMRKRIIRRYDPRVQRG